MKAIPNIKRKMLRLDWDSEAKIAQVRLPILLIAGQRDQLCPMSMTMELYNAATKTQKKTLFTVPGGDHNDTFLRAGPEYVTRLRTFMCECLGEEVPESEPEEEAKQVEGANPDPQIQSQMVH